MLQIPYADSKGRLSVEVHLEHPADVYLLDSLNYRKFQSNQEFRYHGGHYTHTPVHISVIGYGRWYLVVQGEGHYKYFFY